MAAGLLTGANGAVPLPASADMAMMSLQDAGRRGAAKTAESAQEFEAMFLSEMISHMFEGVGVDPVFGGGSGEKMFRSLLTQEYGRLMARGQGIGVSRQLQDMMLRMQEQQQQKG